MKTFRLVFAYLRHNLMSAMAYRGAFWLQVFGMLLNDVMLLFFWAMLFSRFPSLNGWGLRDIVALYGIVAVGFGIATVICGNSGRVAQIIASGDLDYYLALPADPLIHVLVSRTSLPSWGDIVFGVVVYLLAASHPWRTLPLFLLLGGLSGVIFVAFSVIVGALAFWLGQSQNLAMQLRNALLTFGLYPVDIFPSAVRVLLYTLIPAAFVGSLPATMLTMFSWGKLLLLLAFTLVISLAARWIFYLGIRRYESGNLVTARR
jgi:ABC-2 type transport system permease protein